MLYIIQWCKCNGCYSNQGLNAEDLCQVKYVGFDEATLIQKWS